MPITNWNDLQSQVYSTTHIGKTETRTEDQVFQEVLKRVHGKVLDVGCGDGGTVAALKKAGMEVSGLDLPAVAEVAMKRHPGISFYGMDVHQWDDSFYGPWDTAISMDVIEHVEDDLGLLKRLVELAPRVILTTPSHPRKWREQKDHLRWNPPVAMARLLAIAGMVLVEHLIVIQEDTGVFVAERSDLPLEERLKKSVDAAKDPAISELVMVNTSIPPEDAKLLQPFFDYIGPTEVFFRPDKTTRLMFVGRRK